MEKLFKNEFYIVDIHKALPPFPTYSLKRAKNELLMVQNLILEKVFPLFHGDGNVNVTILALAVRKWSIFGQFRNILTPSSAPTGRERVRTTYKVVKTLTPLWNELIWCVSGFAKNRLTLSEINTKIWCSLIWNLHGSECVFFFINSQFSLFNHIFNFIISLISVCWT